MISFDHNHYPHASQRQAIYAKNGMVATSHPLAAQAGLDMLKKGGNAIDAAIATAACLTVVEPTSNGIGGDAFAIVWFKGAMIGLNGSGASPKSISIEKVKALGYKEMPRFGMVPVTVPGVPAAWVSLSERFGNLPFETLLEPAILYAQHGYPITPGIAAAWQRAFEIYQSTMDPALSKHWFETFAPNKTAPKAGDTWQSADHARTLLSIAKTKAASFYEGELADKIDAFSKVQGGFITKEDLSQHRSEWVTPISVKYRGYDVWELPPNGQGIIALQALNMLSEYTFETMTEETITHTSIEALKLAFSDGLAYITDHKMMSVDSKALLSSSYAKDRQKRISEQALMPEPGQPPSGGTVYLATADQEGNMVSYIQSNYMGFGSGIVIPNTGIAMQNRGHTFSLDTNHANALLPNKKTYHTIIPGFLTKGAHAVGPFGVMGGFMQPQGHLQVLINTLDLNMNPQAALDAPRWQWMKEKTIHVEPSFSEKLIDALSHRGHEIIVSSQIGSFGRGQIIWRDPKTKTLIGGTEMRADGTIASY